MSYELCQSQVSFDTNIPTELLGFSLLPQHKTQEGFSVAWLEDRNFWASFTHIQLNSDLTIFKINTVLLSKGEKLSICHVEDIEVMLQLGNVLGDFSVFWEVLWN